MKKDVLCLGILVADLVTEKIRKYPGKGRLELVDKITLHSGGCAANTGIALAKLGLKTGLAGKIGRDEFGDILMDTYRQNNLDLRGVRRSKSVQTSTTVVLVDQDGERSFIHAIGANAEFNFDDIDLRQLKNYKILHVAGTFLLPQLDGEPTSRLLKEAKKMGLITSLDTVWDAKGRWLPLLESSLPLVDIFLPSIEEARMISGFSKPAEITQFFLDYGVGIVGLKMGAEGCYIQTKEHTIYEPAYDIKPIDTTGAGDAFAAGFLTGIVKDWSLIKIARFANAAGAMATLAAGATDGVKSMAETLRFMNSKKLKTAEE